DIVQRFRGELLGALPIDDPELSATFASVLERARCPRPGLFRIAPEGGRFDGAFALPQSRRGQVIFGQSVLDELTPAESAAILGHELAHLEHHDDGKLRRYAAVVYVLIAVIALVVPRWPLLVGAWPLVVFVAVSFWLASQQSHEGDSDLRGIELAGDPEA